MIVGRRAGTKRLQSQEMGRADIPVIKTVGHEGSPSRIKLVKGMTGMVDRDIHINYI
jgi:hypothetical protein